MEDYEFLDVPSEEERQSNGPHYSIGADLDDIGRLLSVKSWLAEDTEVVLDHQEGEAYIDPEAENTDEIIAAAREYADKQGYEEPLGFTVMQSEDNWWENILESVWGAEHGEAVTASKGYDRSQDDLRFN